MALTQDHKLAVIETLVESFRLVWALRMPHVVLAALMALPWALGSALGVFDPMRDFTALNASGQTPGLIDIPFGTMATLWLGSILLHVRAQGPASVEAGVFVAGSCCTVRTGDGVEHKATTTIDAPTTINLPEPTVALLLGFGLLGLGVAGRRQD